MTPDTKHCLLFQPLEMTFFQTFLVHYMVWRAAAKSTKITLKLIVIGSILTILTFSYCVNILDLSDQRHQRSRKRQKRPENGVTSATVY